MCEKFIYEDHSITVNTKGELFDIAVRSLATGETYLNESVELLKIKKDTIFATFEKRNEKGLKCQFRFLDVEPRQLILSFVVDLEYLPQFKEDVILTKVESGTDKFDKLSAMDMQNEINVLNCIINNLEENGPLTIHEKSLPLNGRTQIDTLRVEAGSYLIQVTGVVFSAIQSSQTLQYRIDLKDDKPITMHMKINNMSSYGYPYSFTKSVSVGRPTQILLSMSVSGGSNQNLSNHITTLIPIF